MAAPRPHDVSLTNAKAMQMGFQPDSIKVSLERLKTVANKDATNLPLPPIS